MLMSIRVRYEDGVLIPLEPLEGVENGQEFTVSMAEEEGGAVFVTLPKPEMTPQLQAMIEAAERSAGVFADNPDFEEGIKSVRDAWDAWNRRLSG